MLGCIESHYKSHNPFGHRQTTRNGKGVLAHRLAFQQAYGYLPEVVMHICDNPACVNIEHLRAGTQLDNVRDMLAKRRYPMLFEEDWERIREAVKFGAKQRDLAKMWGISPEHLNRRLRAAAKV